MDNHTLLLDPTALADATRQATLASIDGALKLQAEIQQATLKAWEQARAEAARLADVQGKALHETLQAQREATEKSLHWLREQVERAGAPTAATAATGKTAGKAGAKA
jgi:hypothetical protein